MLSDNDAYGAVMESCILVRRMRLGVMSMCKDSCEQEE